MQNIPSHALDIRHMFRATPEQTEIMKFNTNDNIVTVTLILQDSIPTTSGSKKVKDLTANDIVIMKDGIAEVHCAIQSIVTDKGNATIQLMLIE